MPIPNAFVVQANLDEKHGQNPILTDVIGNGSIDHDLAPKGSLLRVDDNSEDGSDLNGKHEPTLCLLELDQRRRNCDTCT